MSSARPGKSSIPFSTSEPSHSALDLRLRNDTTQAGANTMKRTRHHSETRTATRSTTPTSTASNVKRPRRLSLQSLVSPSSSSLERRSLPIINSINAVANNVLPGLLKSRPESYAGGPSGNAVGNGGNGGMALSNPNATSSLTATSAPMPHDIYDANAIAPCHQRQQILFYHQHDPHYGFTNFSPHPVFYKGKKYPTSEHLFQSFKFQEHRPSLAEHIRTCSERPSVAFSEARRFQPEVRKDWMNVNIQKMDETIHYKFVQHRDLKQELLGTGDAELIEDSDIDSFWGIGADRRGRNELGKALERLRARLRAEVRFDRPKGSQE